MVHTYGWFLLWWVSGFLQVLGLLKALSHWMASPTHAWRMFWSAFLCNWLFTLAHQVLGVLFTPSTDSLLDMSAWLMKLGAMVMELIIMAWAVRLMQTAPPVPGLRR